MHMNNDNRSEKQCCILTRRSGLRKLRLKIRIRSITREGFLRQNIVAVSFFQTCAIHQYS